MLPSAGLREEPQPSSPSQGLPASKKRCLTWNQPALLQGCGLLPRIRSLPRTLRTPFPPRDPTHCHGFGPLPGLILSLGCNSLPKTPSQAQVLFPGMKSLPQDPESPQNRILSPGYIPFSCSVPLLWSTPSHVPHPCPGQRGSC